MLGKVLGNMLDKVLSILERDIFHGKQLSKVFRKELCKMFRKVLKKVLRKI